MSVIDTIINFFKGLLGQGGQKTTPPSVGNAPTVPEPLKTDNKPKEEAFVMSKALPTPPRLDPAEYRERLRAEVRKKGQPPRGYEPIADDPTTRKNERRTYCNFFVREVCSWFGWKNFESPDRDQAGEITRYMRSHPVYWRRITMMETPTLAAKGHLIIAGLEEKNPPPTGHVCIISPTDESIYSGKWSKKVPIGANVGADNWEGKGINWAFGRQEPELYLYLGKQT